jgi:hypothetical protein
VRNDVLLDQLGREEIERAVGEAVEGDEEGWCSFLDAELSEDEEDPDWAAEELLEWRLQELRRAGEFFVGLVEGEFQLTHPTGDFAGRTIILELGLVLERDASGWSVPVCEPLFIGALNDRLSAALAYAVEQHAGQTRKGTAIPYISHVLAVAGLAMEMNPGADVEAIGALLHDVIEDAGGQPRAREIARDFGFDVLRIVLANSDTTVEPKPPWRQRKQRYIVDVAHKAPDELRVSLADKLHNARAILLDYRIHGEALWTRFRAGEGDGVRWYYRQLAAAFQARRDDLGPGGAAAADELDRTVAELDALANEPAPDTARRSP